MAEQDATYGFRNQSLMKVPLMRKALPFALAIAAFALTGCGSTVADEAVNPDTPVTATEYDLEETIYQLPDERFVECFEYDLGYKYGSLSCNLMAPELAPKKFVEATEEFEIAYITNSRDEHFVCLDYDLGYQYGAIACVPAEAR